MENYNNTQVIESLLKTMSYFGGWRPKFITSLWAIRIYTLYSFSAIFNMCFIVTTVFIIFYQNIDRAGDFIDNIFISTSFSLLSFKVVYFNIHRHDVNILMKLFLKKCCLPCNNEELEICRKFEIKGRLVNWKINVFGKENLKLINFIF